MEEILKWLRYRRHHKILDVGTGTGKFVRVLHNTFPESEITGIDQDHQMIEDAKASFRNTEKVHFYKMDSSHIHFPDGFFDVITLSNILHHLPDQKDSFQEIRRVLKPNGLIFIVELYCDGQTEEQITHVLSHHFRAEIDTRFGLNHHFTFKRRQILQQMEHFGLEPILTEDHHDQTMNYTGDHAALNQIERTILKYMEKTTTFPDHKRYANLGNQIINRLYETGYSKPNELAVLAKFDRKDKF